MSTSKLDDILGVNSDNVEPAEPSEPVSVDSTPQEDLTEEKTEVKSESKEDKEEKSVDKKPKEENKPTAEPKSEGKKSSESKEKPKESVKKETKTTKQEEQKDKDAQKSKQVNKVSKDVKAEEANPLREYVDTTIVETDTSEYPFKVILPNPVSLYRGPSLELRSRCVGGLIEVLGAPDSNGFSPITFVRSEFGKVKGYIRLPKEELNKWKH